MTYNYKTYKFYNKKKERLSIYGIQKENNEIDLYIIPCDKNDQFKKKTGDILFSNLGNSKTKYQMLKIAGNNQYGFIRQCNKLFYTEMIININGKFIPTFKNIKTKNKLSNTSFISGIYKK